VIDHQNIVRKLNSKQSGKVKIPKLFFLFSITISFLMLYVTPWVLPITALLLVLFILFWLSVGG